jgi:hypothetical protein
MQILLSNRAATGINQLRAKAPPGTVKLLPARVKIFLCGEILMQVELKVQSASNALVSAESFAKQIDGQLFSSKIPARQIP